MAERVWDWHVHSERQKLEIKRWSLLRQFKTKSITFSDLIIILFDWCSALWASGMATQPAWSSVLALSLHLCSMFVGWPCSWGTGCWYSGNWIRGRNTLPLPLCRSGRSKDCLQGQSSLFWKIIWDSFTVLPIKFRNFDSLASLCHFFLSPLVQSVSVFVDIISVYFWLQLRWLTNL